MKIHKSLTKDMLIEAVRNRNESTDNPGFCIGCGTEHECEPDAACYTCDICGKKTVYSPEILLGFL